jgi:hypothetical protein
MRSNPNFFGEVFHHEVDEISTGLAEGIRHLGLAHEFMILNSVYDYS